MRKLLLPVLFAFLVMGAGAVQAADCVEVDIELPATVTAEAGAFAEGYFELTNCGDEAGLVELSISIEISGIPPFEVGGIQLPIGAGETISREFVLPVPPSAGGNEVTFCIDAAIGEASSSDCATTVIEGGSLADDGTSRTVGFIAASEHECVDATLELPDTVVVEDGASIEEGYLELVNCGDEGGLVNVDVTFQLVDTSVTVSGFAFPLGAGESISREFTFPVPPIVSAGEYGVCITAYIGEAMATSCQTIIVENNFGPDPDGASIDANNYPNPFNPSTTIAFTLPSASDVSVKIYNTLGQEVTTLHDGSLAAGNHNFTWNGSDAASGIYFYRIQTDNETVSKKMVLMK